MTATFIPTLTPHFHRPSPSHPSLTFHSSRPRPPLCKTETPPSPPNDPRGFLIPEQGDVVLYAGRWANEDALGLVSNVRYNPSRLTHIVDVIELRRLGRDLFAVPNSTARKQAAKWMDVAQVRVTPAEYVPEQDAYRVAGTRDGYADFVVNEEDREKARVEYEILKRDLMRETVAVGGVGGALVAGVGGLTLAKPFGLGVFGAIVYLAMLQRGVDVLGGGGLGERLLALRFLVPAVPFAVLASGGEGINKAQALAVVGGLLCYKLPLLWRTGGEVVDGLAAVEMGKTGMVGTVLGAVARQIKRRRDSPNSDVDGSRHDAPGLGVGEKVFVFAGPSGVGKSTLIHRLMEEYPGRFAYSVSHTTRERREGEVDGVDYRFVGHEEFERMVGQEDFVEYARVHGQCYGTSYEAVGEVLRDGRVCIVDLDIQGVEAFRKKTGLQWDARFVWIAPPSIEVLEERLRARGTETADTLKKRLDTATRELTYAATNNVFDLTVINADLEQAYQELRIFVNETAPLPQQ